MVDAGHQAVPRPRSKVGAEVQSRSDADHEHAGQHHRDLGRYALGHRQDGHPEVRGRSDQDDVQERADPGSLAERPPQQQDRQAQDHADRAELDPEHTAEALVECLPGPEPEAGLDHQRDSQPEEDEAQQQSGQPGQDRSGRESLTHSRDGIGAGLRLALRPRRSYVARTEIALTPSSRVSPSRPPAMT